MDSFDFSFNIYQKPFYDKAIENVLNIPDTLPYEEIIKAIHEKFPLPLQYMGVFEESLWKTLTLYRIRYPSKDEIVDESNYKSFGYNPNPSIAGRANLPNESVFYGSTEKQTCYREMKEEVVPNSTIIYLSKWGIRNVPTDICYRNFLLSTITKKDKDDKLTLASELSNAISKNLEAIVPEMPDEVKECFMYAQKRFSEIFTASKDKYHISSALSHQIFSTLKGNYEMPIIMYPSVQDDNGINMAIRKDFVDKYLYLKEVDKILIRQKTDKVLYFPLKRATVENNVLTWHNFNFSEDGLNYAAAAYSSDGRNFTPLNNKIYDSGKLYSIRDYIYDRGVTDEHINSLVSAANHSLDDFVLSQQEVHSINLELSGGAYADEEMVYQKIKHISIPIAYSMVFENEIGDLATS